jgi:hypothetical protein
MKPVTLSLLLLALVGCSRPLSPGSLVITLVPHRPADSPALDTLDLRFPAGSRVVLAEPPFDSRHVRLLSSGLRAAGDPVGSYDGASVFFAGKPEAASSWQIYVARLSGGRPRVLTAMPGGAMEPALLPDGSLVFASPVPPVASVRSHHQPSALYAQSPGAKPRQLTFGVESMSDPTLLPDGRILFVAALPRGQTNSARGTALYTINNDGTEITAFAAPDQVGRVERPRWLADGRIAFVARGDAPRSNRWAGYIVYKRTCAAPRPLFPSALVGIRSVQPASHGDLLVCAEPGSWCGTSRSPSALFRMKANATTLGVPLFADAREDVLEAVETAASARPMGRISTVDPARRTGLILCLNANDSTYCGPDARVIPAARVRVLAGDAPHGQRPLGDVPLQPDGSFMAEVPADTPLGFEALDEQGRVLRRLSPMVWVRPGENRSCIGCHETPNRAPHNRRPLATLVSVPSLGGGNQTLP